MMDFGGDKIGHPWHGLYRAATEKIETPAGGDIDLPGDPPDGGNCWLVQIPGLPEPETTPAEAATGRTWTNYALISDQKIYGRGISGPLYIDSAGRAWALTIFRSGSRATKLLTVNISAKRFGEIGPGTAPTTTLPAMSVAFETHADYPSVSGESSSGFLLDVAKNGTKLLFGVTRLRGYAAVAEVTLTGSPADGNFAGTIALLADESTIDEWPTVSYWTTNSPLVSATHRAYDWSAPPMNVDTTGLPPASPGTYTSDTGTTFSFNGYQYATHIFYRVDLLSEAPVIFFADALDDGYMSSFVMWPTEGIWLARLLAGARYNSDWSAEIAVSETENSFVYDASYPGVTWPTRLPIGASFNANAGRFETIDQSLVVRVSFGADSSEINQSILTETTHIGAGNNQVTSTLTRAGAVVKSVTTTKGLPWYLGNYALVYGLSLAPAESVGGAARLTNSIYFTGVKPLELGPETGLAAGEVRFGGSNISGELHGRLGRTPRAFVYASEHPVTGQIGQGSNVVCWV